MPRYVPNRNRSSNQGFPRSDDPPCVLVAFTEPRRDAFDAVGTEPCSAAQKRKRDRRVSSCSGHILVQERRILFKLAHDQRRHRRVDGMFLISQNTIDEGVG